MTNFKHNNRGDVPNPDPEDLPSWFQPKGIKTKHDFPKAKRGRTDRYEFMVSEKRIGKPKRIDKYLMERFKGYSRSFLQKLIKDGRVLVNGKPVKASWHIQADELITIMLPEAAVHEPEDIPFEVLFEDEHFIAVSKPSGVIVHPARGRKTGTLLNALLHYYNDQIEEDPSFHIGIVHRLDIETSGVMVIALDLKAHGNFTQQFEKRALSKTYLLLVHGKTNFDETEVDLPLGVDPKDKHRYIVDGLEAKTAQTRFKTIAHSACGKFSLLRAYPRTGRTHQIRVHVSELGFPIVADETYGGWIEDPAFGELKPRMSLHAETLELKHPIHEHEMKIHAPMPQDMRALAKQLKIEWENSQGN